MANNLTMKQAINMCVELFNIQAGIDHASIVAAQESLQNDFNTTDAEILALFPANQQKIYKNNHADKYNFYTEPEALVSILQADETYGSSFVGYEGSLEGNVITLSKESEEDIAFTITTSGDNASIEAASTDYTVNYKNESVVHND